MGPFGPRPDDAGKPAPTPDLGCVFSTCRSQTASRWRGSVLVLGRLGRRFEWGEYRVCQRDIDTLEAARDKRLTIVLSEEGWLWVDNLLHLFMSTN